MPACQSEGGRSFRSSSSPPPWWCPRATPARSPRSHAFFLDERGEVGGVEDAFLTWNDVGDARLDVSFGQFRVSDPRFKRELRLVFDDDDANRARTDGGFVELLLNPGERRGYAFALWNRLTADRPVMNPRRGGPADVDLYHAVSAGAG